MLFLFVCIIFFTPSFAQVIKELTIEQQNRVQQLEEVAEVSLAEKDFTSAGSAYSKIAFIFWKANLTQKAIDNFVISADLYLQKNKYNEVKNIYSNLGLIYSDIEELDIALEYFNKSLEVRRKMRDNSLIASGLIDVSYILQSLNYNNDAIDKLNEALTLALKEKNTKLILYCYQLLSVNYEKIGNTKKAQDFADKAESYKSFVEEEEIKKDFEEEVIATEQKVAKSEEEKRMASLEYELNQLKLLTAQDSLNVTIKAKQDSLTIASEQAKAKSLEISKLNTEKDLQESKIKEQEAKQKSQRLVIFMIALGLLFMIILAIIMIRSNRSKKIANTKLEKQNKEIAEKNEALGIASDKIAKQNISIKESINYAQGIQKALLPKTTELNQIIPQSFILFMPRDVVSGDFYWFREILDSKTSSSDNKIIVSAIDCTGHGVPGAFMSMIGYNLMDEIIIDKGVTRPDLILSEMHKGVQLSLKQKETKNQDGMDMVVCAIDKNKKILEFSGANNPIVYVQNQEVKQIKGSRNGIGGKSEDNEYELHKIDLNVPTCVYIFSDGYIDQFGGEDGMKFMIKKFRKLLLKNHQLPMKEQLVVLKNTLKEWIGSDYNQIDDILVIGFKLDL